MAINTKRRITEDEVLFVEEAFFEFQAKGTTDKKCPWCNGDLKFKAAISAYSIECSECDFIVTVRGI